MNLAEFSQYQALQLVVAALVGAAIGSFITLITYRLPRGEKVGVVRSKCTHCKGALNLKDLLPLFSWAWWRGKCRMCRVPISARYPLIELACALGAVAVVLVYGFTLQALAITGLWWCIVAIIVTDLEHYIILDEVQIATALFGILYVYANQTPWLQPAMAAIAGVTVGLALKYGFLFFANKDGLGMGDVKFLGVAGIWLSDATNFVPFLFFSGLFGILSGLAWRWLRKSERFPFGPALALALLVCVLVPEAPNGFWKLYGAVQ